MEQLERPFLDDILAHPHDDAPRLIFADWIEDHAEALPPSVRDRGQLIRVHYALESLDDEDPRRSMLETRAHILIHRHSAEWTAGLSPAQAPRFRRGFIEGLSLAYSSAALAANYPLRRLQILADVISHWARTRETAAARAQRRKTEEQRHAESAKWPLLAQIEELDLSTFYTPESTLNSWLEAVTLTRVSTLSIPDHLLSLFLTHVDVPLLSHVIVLGRAPAEVTQAPTRQLDSLTLIGPVAEIGVYLTPFGSGLRRFHLHECKAPVQLGPAITTLERLELSQITVHLKKLADQGPFPQLKRLVLKACQLKEPNTGTALKAERFPALRSLTLRSVSHAKGIGSLANSTLLPQLESLVLAANRLRLDDVAPLSQHLPRGLRCLDLSWNPLGSLVVSHLATSPAISSLESLNLSYCSLNSEVGHVFYYFPSDGRLLALNLATNRIGREGLQHLLRSSAASRLEALDISNNHLDDSAVDLLLAWPRLRDLSLLAVHGNDLSEAAQARLRAGFQGMLL